MGKGKKLGKIPHHHVLSNLPGYDFRETLGRLFNKLKEILVPNSSEENVRLREDMRKLPEFTELKSR